MRGSTSKTFFTLLLSCLIIFITGAAAFSAAVPVGPTVTADTEEEYWAKINKISPPPAPPSDTSNIIASRLENLAAGKTSAADVFRNMGADGIRVSDLYGFKADYIRAKADELAKANGASAVDVLPQAFSAWESQYGKAEKTLMDARRKAVQRAWDRAVKAYAQKHPNMPYIIKMDVGGWASESWSDLRFEGDIDFSAITSQVENAAELRDLYNREIKADLGMDMAALDAHATAHRGATLDVYITQPGADWAEIDALDRGKLQEVVVKGDEVTYRPVTDSVERLYVFANLKNNVDMKQGAPDKLAAIMDEGVPQPTLDMEPAVSLEFLRHLTTDAIRSNLAPHERLIKLAKFVNRSAADHEKMLKGYATTAADADLVSWAKKVTDIKQDKGLSAPERLKKILEASRGMLGSPGDSGALERSLNSLAERSTRLIRHNIGEGVDARMKAIDEAGKETEKDELRKKLLDELEQTYDAYREKGVDYPPKAYDAMISLAEHFKKKAFHIPISEQRRLAELLEKAADNPDSTRLMMALAWEKTGQYYDAVNDKIDAFNNLLDTLDTVTVDKLRALNTEFRFGGEGNRINITVPIPIGAINDRLNSSILGTIGNSMPFKAVNLFQEGQAYVDAIMRGKDWNESFTNLSTEIFRTHVPGGDIVEAVVMENYTRAAIGVVYLLFPVTAVPEGIYGLSMAAATWGVGRWEQWQYDEMVEELYEGTTFKKAGDSWKVDTIAYNQPGKGTVCVSAETAWTLPEKCPAISNILQPQVKDDPGIVMYHELLVNKAISDGRSDIPVWPRKYKNLSRYGEKLWREYADAVTRTTQRYFVGVIEELEKRRDYEQGETAKKLKEIENELGCDKPVLEPTGDVAEDRKNFEELISMYGKLKQVNAELLKIREEWSAFSLREHRPVCSAHSIKKTLEEATAELAAARQAVKDATVGVEEIVGRSETDHFTLQPAVKARIGAVVYPEGSDQRKEYIKEYRDYLDTLRKNATDLAVRIIGPDVVCQGAAAGFSAALDRDAKSVKYDWKFEPAAEGETLEKRKSATATWKPASAGRFTLTVYAKLDKADAEWTWAKKEVTVLSPEDCPRPVVKLTAPVTEIGAGEILPLEAVTAAFGLNGQGFERYFWLVNGRQIRASAENLFSFDGRGYEGQKVTVTVKARTSDGYVAESSLDVTVGNNAAGESLRVMITPETSEIKAGERVTFRAVVLGRAAEGDLRFQWSVDDRAVANGDMFIMDTDPGEGKTFTLGLYSQQVKDGRIVYEGQTTRKISVVRESKVSVSLAQWPASVSDTQNLRVRVKNPDQKLSYQWFEWRGRYWSTNPIATGPAMAASMRGLAGQIVRYKVVAVDSNGRTASAETGDIKVTEPEWDTPEPEEEEIPTAAEKDDGGKDDAQGSASDRGAESNVTKPEDTEAAWNEHRIALKAPDKAMTGDIFSVTADVPSDIAAKTRYYSWSPDVASKFKEYLRDRATTDSPSAELQFSYGWSEPTHEGQVSVTAQDADRKALASGLVKIKILPMGLSVSAPSVWEGGPTEKGVSLKRQVQKKANPKASGATVSGSFTLKIDRNRRTPEEVKEAVTAMGYSSWKVEKISIGDFHGYMTLKEPYVGPVRGQMSYADWVQITASTEVIGIVTKGGLALEFSGVVGGGGDIMGDKNHRNNPATNDRFFLMAHMEQGFAELKSIVSSITVTPDPKRTTTPWSAPEIKAEEDIKVKLVRVKPAEGPVSVGGTLTLKAEVEGETPEGGWVFRFQPHPDVTFEPFEGSDPSTKAVFTEPGKVSLWVELLKKEGETLSTAATSEQIQVEVTGSALSLSASPKPAKVGDEVTVKAAAKPELPDGAFVVWRIEGKAKNAGAKAADSTIYTFTATEPGKYTVSATARSEDGEDMGEAEMLVEVSGFEVKTTVVGTAGPRPKEWKEGEGLKDVPKGTFLADENVTVKAEITDKNAPKDIGWKWTPADGTSMASTGSGQEATLSRHEPGTATATVEARNRDDMLLGKGSVSFPVVALPPELKAKPLKIELTGDSKTTVNGSVKLTAETSGGTKPYTWKWSGNVEAKGGGASFVAATPGETTVSVTVTDKAGKTASASHKIAAAEFEVTLLDVPSKIPFGKSFTPRVEFPVSPSGSDVNTKPAPNIYWKAEPDVKMASKSGAGKTNTVTANRPGKFDLWVEVENGRGDLLGKSNKHAISVSSPEFSLKTPDSIPAGKTGRVEAVLPGGLDPSLLRFEWSASAPISTSDGNSSRTASVGPARSLKPVEVTLKIADRSTGSKLAEMKKSIEIKPLELKIEVGICSPPSKIVHSNGKVDYVETGTYTEGQTIGLKAVPQSSADGVTWKWEANQGTSFKGSAGGESVTVYRDKTGTASVTAIAMHSGEEIGRAAIELPVNTSKNQAQAANEFLTAQNAWNSKQYESAVSSMKKALSLDPGNDAIQRELARMENEAKKQETSEAEKIWNQAAELQKQKKYEEALDKYREGLEIHEDPEVLEHTKRLEAVIAAENADRANREKAEAIWTEAANLQNAKQYEDALGKYREGLEIYNDPKVAEHADKLEKFIREQKVKQAEAEQAAAEKEQARDRAEKIWNQAAELQNAKKYRDALSRYYEGLKIFEDPEIRSHVKKLEEFIRSQKAKETAAKQKAQQQQAAPSNEKPAPAVTSTSSNYTPNSSGDVFNGGHWAGGKNGSDWIQKDLGSVQEVSRISIARASTDITTDGFRLTLKLQKENGQWVTVDELRDTNINRTQLSGGNVGNSIPSYSKSIDPPIRAKAFRLEFKGHGWFDAGDIRLTMKKVSGETQQTTAAKTEPAAAKSYSGWKTLTNGPVTFQVPPDWQTKSMSISEGKMVIAWKGDMNNPEEGVAVGFGDYEELVDDFNREKSQGTVGQVTVGGRTFQQVTSTIDGVRTMMINCGRVGGQGLGILVPTRSWNASKATIEKVLSSFKW